MKVVAMEVGGRVDVVFVAPGEEIGTVAVIEADSLPSDRTFRGAWALVDGQVQVDMPKAREIWRGLIRTARAPVLARLDVEWQRAAEEGDAERQAAVLQVKTRLRDAPEDPRIEAATTPEELLALWPEELL